jgi:hypothetical protein
MNSYFIDQRLQAVSTVNSKSIYNCNNQLAIEELKLHFLDGSLEIKYLESTKGMNINYSSEVLIDIYPEWASDFIGKSLRNIWLSDNPKGYKDIITLAFGDPWPDLIIYSKAPCLSIYKTSFIL